MGDKKPSVTRLVIVKDNRIKNLSELGVKSFFMLNNEMYYFPAQDIISGFDEDTLYCNLTTGEMKSLKRNVSVVFLNNVQIEGFRN